MKKIVIIMCALFLVGCYEDKGNYDYIEIGNITIDDIDETYNRSKYMTLEITPVINVERIDEKNLGYLWEVNGKAVSEERNLNYDVSENFKPEPYVCRLTVTNKIDNSKYFKTFKLMVVTPFHKGLSILSGTADDKSMLSYCPYSEKDVPGEVIHDVFFNENEYKMEGRPISLQEGDDWDDFDGDLFINTSKGGYAITSGIMKVATHYGVNRMMEPDENIDIKGISFMNYSMDNYGGFISNGKMYPICGYNPYFSLPSLDPCPVGTTGKVVENYYLSEYFIARTNSWGSKVGMIVYDNNMGRFLYMTSDYSAQDSEQMRKVAERDTLGLKMFYMGVAETAAYKHAALFHDGSYSSWTIMPFLTTGYTLNTERYPLASHHFNKDSKVVIETNYSKLYYSSGGKLYMIYLTDTSKQFESNEFKIEGLGNDKIIMMKFKDWREQILYIGVESEEKSKIYEVNMSTKKIINTIEGFEGKVVDVFYR